MIIEDNPLGVKMLQYIFEYEPEWCTEFIVVEDGEEAIEYLLHSETAKPALHQQAGLHRFFRGSCQKIPSMLRIQIASEPISRK